MVFDLGGKRCLHYPRGYDVRPHIPVPQLDDQHPKHLHRPRLGRCVDALTRFDNLRRVASPGTLPFPCGKHNIAFADKIYLTERLWSVL